MIPSLFRRLGRCVIGRLAKGDATAPPAAVREYGWTTRRAPNRSPRTPVRPAGWHADCRSTRNPPVLFELRQAFNNRPGVGETLARRAAIGPMNDQQVV
jgi:hypothetical protein